ncbi:hypothetical protein D3C75_589950 [compost metagenome]
MEWTIKNSRLVHVIPDAVHPLIIESSQIVRPPIADILLQEIRKSGFSRPHFTDESRTVRIFRPIVIFGSFLIHTIVLVLLDSRIINRNRVKSLAFQCLKCLLVLIVPGEHAVAIHVVDVKMHRIERNLLFTVFIGHTHQLFRCIAPFTLMESQRPHRRRFRFSRQLGIFIDDITDFRAVDEVISQRAAVGVEIVVVVFFAGHFVVRAIRIIEENTVCLFIFQSYEEWNRCIKIFCILVIGIGVRIPHAKTFAALVQPAGLLTESIEVFSRIRFLEYIRLAVLIAYTLCRIFVNDITLLVQKLDAERTFINFHCDFISG